MVGKSTNPLDLFYLLLEQRILVCRSCKAGVAPRHLVTHIRAHHRGLYSAFRTKQSAIEWVQDRLLPSLPCALLDPVIESIPVPPADAKAFPVLKVHVSYGCMYYLLYYSAENAKRFRQNNGVFKCGTLKCVPNATKIWKCAALFSCKMRY